MIIYHGSTEPVDKPEIRVNDTYLDFGMGFYTTTSYEQAERWAHIKMRRLNKSIGYVSIYEFDFDAAMREVAVRREVHGLMSPQPHPSPRSSASASSSQSS